MFSTIVTWIIFAVTTIGLPFMWAHVVKLPSPLVNWTKVWVITGVWFASGTYLFG